MRDDIERFIAFWYSRMRLEAMCAGDDARVYLLLLGRSECGLYRPVGFSMAQRAIAVVDDDRHIINLLHDLLGDEGYRTIAVTDGASAPAAIARERPDLVILDLWMERQDTGWAVYDALRADAATARIPVLVCSADLASLHSHAADLRARGDAAMEKPFNITEMLALVDRLLAGAGGQGNPYPSPVSCT